MTETGLRIIVASIVVCSVAYVIPLFYMKSDEDGHFSLYATGYLMLARFPYVCILMIIGNYYG